MKQFFNNLLSGSNETSSKRFAALVTLGNIIILAYLAAWKSNWVLPQYMFDGLCLVVGSGLGLTVIEKIFAKNAITPAAAQSDLPPAVDDKPQQPAVDSPDAPDQH